MPHDLIFNYSPHSFHSESSDYPVTPALPSHAKGEISPVGPNPTTDPTMDPTTVAALDAKFKALKVTIHGTHIYQVGWPKILVLGGVLASERITRSQFFEILNLMVRKSCTLVGDRAGLTREDLLKLGIAPTLAEVLPIKRMNDDGWTLIGLFAGALDELDFDRRTQKDELWKYYFAANTDTEDKRIPFRLLDLLGYTQDDASISQLCAELEERYYPPTHYLLSMLAATRKEQPLINHLGLFESYSSSEKKVNQLFRIAGPEYSTVFQDPRTFTFNEDTACPVEVPFRFGPFVPDARSPKQDKQSKDRGCFPPLCTLV